ncbi:MAG: purine-nucleoside phosphorylase [Deltaproteobacteria bacterium]|nr:purine-nucleoside phosphorylase [Deltaproteobacteria bacterium]
MTHSPFQVSRLDTAVESIRTRVTTAPRVALVLGSGLGDFADTLEDAVAIPFAEIPTMPVSGVQGHAGKLVFGRAEGVDCVAMQGRVHLYEGHPASDVVFGLRLMIRLGAKIVVITNAAGGANPRLDAGELMLIEDHLNLTGTSSLLGPNEDALGPRFPDMTAAYDLKLRELALGAASEAGFQLARGIYAGLLGPSYETPAEVRMVFAMGADAVGMSTVLETVAARHMGARVLGISCITNKGAGLSHGVLDHSEVTETANRVKGRFVGLLRGVLARIAKGEAE